MKTVLPSKNKTRYTRLRICPVCMGGIPNGNIFSHYHKHIIDEVITPLQRHIEHCESCEAEKFFREISP